MLARVFRLRSSSTSRRIQDTRFHPPLHLDGWQETFWEGKHCQLLAWWERESSIMRKGGGGEEEEAEIQRTVCPWGGYFFKNFPRKLIVSNSHFFVFLCLLSSFVLTDISLSLFVRWRRNIDQAFSWMQHVTRAWVPKHVVQREKNIYRVESFCLKERSGKIEVSTWSS